MAKEPRKLTPAETKELRDKLAKLSPLVNHPTIGPHYQYAVIKKLKDYGQL